MNNRGESIGFADFASRFIRRFCGGPASRVSGGFIRRFCGGMAGFPAYGGLARRLSGGLVSQ